WNGRDNDQIGQPNTYFGERRNVGWAIQNNVVVGLRGFLELLLHKEQKPSHDGIEAEPQAGEPEYEFSLQEPQRGTRRKQRDRKRAPPVRDVADERLDTIRKVDLSISEKIVIEKGVDGLTVFNQSGQSLIACNADRRIGLRIEIDHQDRFSVLGRKR